MAFQNFIVLGIIPGTNIQISFQFWLTSVLVAMISYWVWTHRPLVRMHLMILRIRLAIAVHQLEIK